MCEIQNGRLAWASWTKTLRSFLGFGSYYRRFVSRFAAIASPKHLLTAPFVWTEQCQLAFKELLISAPVLAFPQFDRPFRVETEFDSELYSPKNRIMAAL